MNDAGRIGFVIKGAYDVSATYDFLDVVYYNGASYVAKKLTTGNTPQEFNEYWQVFAKSDTLTNISDATADFTIAQTRVNIQSGEDSKTLFGKIKRWFTDLKDVAFTGSYSDLSDAPTIPAAVAVKGNAESTYRTGNVNLTSDNIGAVAVSKVLPTPEQIDANTDTRNVAGATAVKAIKSDLTNSINQINSNLSGQTPFDICLKRNYDYTTHTGWAPILEWHDKNGRTGFLHEYNTELNLMNERGDIYINGHSISDIINNINNLKDSRTWKVILSTQTNGTHESQALSGAEILLMYGYVYRVEATMIIPMDVFRGAIGEGAKILFDKLEIQVPDSTHIKVSGIESNGYLFRVFVR